MELSPHLTPLNKSILYPAIQSALRKLAREIGAPPSFGGNIASPESSGRTAPYLAAATLFLWGSSPAAIEHLLATDMPKMTQKGKAARGLKFSQRLIETFPPVHGRLRRWAENVMVEEWHQANLLQVMEEVEPMMAEVVAWETLLSVAAVGAYAHLGELLGKEEKDKINAEKLRLSLVGGLETPDSRLLASLMTGKPAEKVRKDFWHMSTSSSLEISSPRIGELSAEDLFGAPSPIEPRAWDVSGAQALRKEAQARALRQAGFLQRSKLKKAIDLTQTLLITHAQAREALAFALAATRRWAQAAAEEGAQDGRILDPDEIFMLEIEEIKQMMTGEWHERADVEPLIVQRKNERKRHTPRQTTSKPLGVAGPVAHGALRHLQSPDQLVDASGPLIVRAYNFSPRWWRVMLQADGVIAEEGDLLSWIASVARSGNLPTLVAGESYAAWDDQSQIQLSPARHQAEKSG